MAPFENMSTVEKEELAISLAALICADAKVELTNKKSTNSRHEHILSQFKPLADKSVW